MCVCVCVFGVESIDTETQMDIRIEADDKRSRQGWRQEVGQCSRKAAQPASWVGNADSLKYLLY